MIIFRIFLAAILLISTTLAFANAEPPKPAWKCPSSMKFVPDSPDGDHTPTIGKVNNKLCKRLAGDPDCWTNVRITYPYKDKPFFILPYSSESAGAKSGFHNCNYREPGSNEFFTVVISEKFLPNPNILSN